VNKQTSLAMAPLNRTLQLISIQHELAMSIGLELNLNSMLTTFMQRIQQRLSLRAVYIFSDDQVKQPQWCYPNHDVSPQQRAVLHEAIQRFNEQSHDEYSPDTGTLIYLFRITQVGTLVLQRSHQAIDLAVLHALKPLIKRLAVSCQACLEHQALKDEIAARQLIEQQLLAQTFEDALTHLPNRKSFNLSLQKELNEIAERQQSCAVFFIDVDRFKLVNDALGHAVGDELLIAVAAKLSSCIRSEDILARVGGDEFTLLLKDLGADQREATEKASIIAQKIMRLTAQPMKLNQHTVHISLSIGICLYPSAQLPTEKRHANLAASIVSNADLAMYVVKHNNRNGYLFYHLELHVAALRRTNIEKQLHTALHQQEFQLFLQPLVNSIGEVIAAEALLRWHNKELGWVSPAEFIPIAEECGLIVDISDWVVLNACQLIAELERLHAFSSLQYISVNISPRHFNQPLFVSNLLNTVALVGIENCHLRLEITEGVALEDIERAIEIMQVLRGHQLYFMLDDFGNGYSSLSYLHKLPLHAVKIDRSFISQIDQKTSNQVIVNAMIGISAHFSLACIVEGIENPAEASFFATHDIAAFQGFHFFKPMAQPQFLALLA
jgi:diguanylate cyclase